MLPVVEECTICLDEHDITKCSLITDPQHIEDVKPISKAYATLPSILSIDKMCDGSERIITKSFLSKGTRFGPVDSKYDIGPPLNDGFHLKVFLEDDVCHYLSTGDKEICNWMCLVQPAKSFCDSNLVAYQKEFKIYYSVLKDVELNTELKVYYAPCYSEKMGMKFVKNLSIDECLSNYDVSEDVDDLLEDPIENFEDINQPDPLLSGSSCVNNDSTNFGEEIVESFENNSVKSDATVEMLSAKSLGVSQDKSEWTCSLCGAIFQNIPSFAKHLRDHYTIKAGPIQREEVQSGCLFSANILLPTVTPCTVNHITNSNFTVAFNLGDELQVMPDLSCVPLIPTAPFMYTPSTRQKEELISCDICLKRFYKKVNLLRHLRKHSGDFFCKNCEKVFARKENFVQHICNGMKFQCDKCGNCFDGIKQYKQHIAEHRKDGYLFESLNCPICSHNANSMSEFLNHLRSHSYKDFHNKNIQQCPICKRRFRSMKNFYLTHLNVHETNVHCISCRRVFGDEKHYRLHPCATTVKTSGLKKSNTIEKMQIKYRKPHTVPTKAPLHSNNEQNEPSLLCDVCYRSFPSKIGLKIHKKVHEKLQKENQLSHGITALCDTCGQNFDSQTNLQEHLDTEHFSTSKCLTLYKCTQLNCKKEFTSEDKLLAHLQKHKDREENQKDNVYPCAFCCKIFQKNKYRRVHIQLKHSNSYKYSCNQCDKKFKIAAYLYSHIKHCHSTSPSRLKSQIEKTKLNCHLCKCVFVSKSCLEKHIENHNRKVYYECEFCKKQIVREKCMIQHLKKKHEDMKHVWNDETYVKQLACVTVGTSHQEDEEEEIGQGVYTEETNEKELNQVFDVSGDHDGSLSNRMDSAICNEEPMSNRVDSANSIPNFDFTEFIGDQTNEYFPRFRVDAEQGATQAPNAHPSLLSEELLVYSISDPFNLQQDT